MASATEQVPVEQETNVKEQALESMRNRLGRLKPLRDEANDLEALLDAIDQVENGKQQPEAAQPESETDTPPAQPPQRRRRRRRRGGTRTDQFVQVVKENDGISVSEAAEKMGIAPNYLYRLVPQESRLTKDKDGSLHATS